MELMEKIKAECEKQGTNCYDCVFFCEGVCSFDNSPAWWDIEAIRRALGETSDKASDKKEIVVPKKIELCTDNMPTAVTNAIKINQIINCLEQIKERLK